MNKILTISLALQIIVVFCFLYFVHQSDLAMDKDGNGNLGSFFHYSYYAGIAVYSAIGFWVATSVAILISKRLKTAQGQAVISIPPLLAIFGWFSLWFI